jgi:hypothetical protein
MKKPLCRAQRRSTSLNGGKSLNEGKIKKIVFSQDLKMEIISIA